MPELVGNMNLNYANWKAYAVSVRNLLTLLIYLFMIL